MKKIILLAIFALVVGCSSNSGGYTKVNVSSSEAEALKNLSEPLKVGQTDTNENVSTTTLGNKKNKVSFPGLTK